MIENGQITVSGTAEELLNNDEVEKGVSGILGARLAACSCCCGNKLK